ncbi:hypothetical protein RGUI_2777 [Rhodovulum sp. P5]|uniref:hypothetical protein n=1 Tax=Rhodovulum sp. P5 TaxID=1564506 RepID=UPI0009C298B4|nr:hypothetical protein [Rhodovulum sp. P5]ARE40918.1 hypothetical protein RGUI_2777 [Rhodovulum sp. P5]
MRDYGPATNAALADPGPRLAEILIWVEARNRESGGVEALGLWTGAQTETFSIGGADRTYVGAGTMVGVPQMTRAIGLDVRVLTLRLLRASPAVRAAVMTYDARHAPVEMRRALYDPATGGLVDEPHVVFRGFLDELDAKTAPLGDAAEMPAKLVPRVQTLTRTLPARWAAETGRSNDDEILKYAVLSGETDFSWGTG